MIFQCFNIYDVDVDEVIQAPNTEAFSKSKQQNCRHQLLFFVSLSQLDLSLKRFRMKSPKLVFRLLEHTGFE
ncbi:CLUMA_CG011468, isoform A [Clunio marinus]|uniref:CLUMA_CG011468, isoform A n=1 Tax=Clunio marinus TaxID=568069 RepID=A0A1J1IEW9_9DIPT|nr:CLUMA_CG011468, isoform A [Clunio marinus]